jgi:hypothetical protein
VVARVSTTVCLSANALRYPEGGGHLWVYLNWALGLRSAGCRVIWLEKLSSNFSAPKVREKTEMLRERLAPYGLADSVALCSSDGEPLPKEVAGGVLDLDAAISEADLLLNLRYGMREKVVRRFRRSALLDIDPGLLQIWMRTGQIHVAPHDTYFTTGEGVESDGVKWLHTPPCVALERWPETPAGDGAAWTTVSHWGDGREWVRDGEVLYQNDKRAGFEPCLGLPGLTDEPLELALCLGKSQKEDRYLLERFGWRVRHSYDVASTPEGYREYIGGSRGEFSCAKPSCARLAKAWVSDRTLCYLASGKPAVVEYTGPSEFLPDGQGIFRFRDVEGAASALDAAASDYERHSRLARSLAEERFDAREVVGSVLERAMA